MGGQPGVLTATPALRGPRLAAAGAAAALLLIGAVALDPVAALFAKAVTDPLFHSTSAGGAVALLALVALGLASCAMTSGAVASGRVRIAAVLLLGGCGVGNLANVGLHLALMDAAGLPRTMAVYLWSGDTNTYSYVLHTHAGKAALHALLAGWSQPLTSGFDLGAGLAALVPPAGVALMAASLVAAVAGYALLLPAVLRRWPGWPVALLFVDAACNAIKTMADGGALTYRCAPALAVLLVLLPRLADAGARLRLAGHAAAAGVLAASAAASCLLAGARAEEALHSGLTTLAVIAALVAWAARDTAWPRLRRIGGGLAAGVVATSLAASLVATPLTLLLPLPDGATATVCRDARACIDEPVGGRSAFDVYRQAGDDPLKPRRTLIAERPGAAVSTLDFAIQPLDARTPSAPAASVIAVQARRALPGRPGVLVQARTTRLPTIFDTAPGPYSAANYYVFLHLTAATLRAQGLDRFVMAPVRGVDDARALGLESAP